MSDFSTLPIFVLLMVRVVCVIVVGLLVLIAGVLLWSRHGAAGFVFQQGDQGTLVVVAGLLVATLALIFLIGRELRRMPRT